MVAIPHFSIVCPLTSGCVSGLNFVEGWIGQVDVPSIHFFLAQADTFAKPLEVDNFPLS